MILLCYDGSEDARAAIEHAGRLLPGRPATVLTVWEPFIEVLSRACYGLGMAGGPMNIEEIDAGTRKSAERQAEAGATLARDAGLDAQPCTCTQLGTVANAILATAAGVDAAAIVVGSRGLTGVKSLLLGSVSHALIQQADRTVIVVPGPDVAAARAANAEASADRERTAHPSQPPLVVRA